MKTLAIWLTHRSVACWRATPDQAARLERELPGWRVVLCTDEVAFRAALSTAQIAVVWRFEQAWLAEAPQLRWLATPAAGRDYFSLTPPPGLTVTYGSFHGELIGETVLAMMLASCRGLLAAHGLQFAGERWPRATLAPQMRSLRGTHIAILGFGAIGQWVGRLAKPFGARLTGIRRSPMPRPDWFAAADQVATLAELDVILPTVDHLVLALPADTGTDCLLDERRLGLLPNHAYLHNVGRGNAVDETALAAALQVGKLAGACLDVFQTEPLPADSPLRACPNLLLLPHASAIAPHYLDLYWDEFIGTFRRLESTI